MGIKRFERAKVSNKYLTAGALLLLLLSALYFLKAPAKYLPALPQTVDFNYDIRPIFVQKCFLCHGPDPGSRKGNLRLDTYEGATALSKEGLQAIDPGHADKSSMVFRINHKDPEMMMPVPTSNLKLTEREIALIEKWIEQGAIWKQHWSFIPPKFADDKSFKEADRKGIDYFINEKLDENGLTAAGEADKNTLIRRVTYLLTGLPPTPEAIEAFIADKGPKAYEKIVDNYLASNRYGERWARHWMDIVRYAETKGHEFDYTIAGAWRYRDYLVRAYNDDLPYDQFIKEQIAGDLLKEQRINVSNGSNESHLATVFYAMSEGTHSPVDIRKDEADRIDNIIDVTSKAFQGLTISCARCHDHKFDPISTKDYYSLFGVLEGTRFSPVSVNLPTEKINFNLLQQQKDSIKKLIASKWMEELTVKKDKPIVNVPTIAKANPSATIMLGDFRENGLGEWKSDGLAFGNKTTLGNPIIDQQNKIVSLDEGKASSRFIGTGLFGALRSKDFIIDKNFIGVCAQGKNASIRIVIDNFQLIQWPIYGGIEQRVDTTKWTNFTLDVTPWKGQKAYIEILPGVYDSHVFKMPKDAFIEAKYAIAFDSIWTAPPTQKKATALDLKEALTHWESSEASSDEINALNGLLHKKAFSATIPSLSLLLDTHKELSSSFSDSTDFFDGVYDGFGKNSPVFIRGSHQSLSEKPVARSFLSAIKLNNTNNLNVAGSGRLQLAQSIVDPSNPLTARVMVNRIWHHLFGKGIVETVDNFGLQGKLPTHPDLLDYLAVKFQKENYSVKKMIRTILLTEAFKRSVPAADASEKIDPDNVWLSHYPLIRIESEAIRDAMLFAAEKLDTTMYGKPVKVYITDFMNGRGKPGVSGPIDGLGRRSIYQEVRRNFLDPMMTTFDRPIPFTSFGKRTVTNVPSQALILLNDPFVAMQAGAMATNLLANKNRSFDHKIQWIYERALSRQATSEEIADAKSFMQQLTVLYKKQPTALNDDKAIWKDYIHSVFNLKEFIYLN